MTLTGGPATGLAFAPLFEQAGVAGAASIAVAAAMAGIVCGRHRRRAGRHVADRAPRLRGAAQRRTCARRRRQPAERRRRLPRAGCRDARRRRGAPRRRLLKNVVADPGGDVDSAPGSATASPRWASRCRAYIGAMLVAAAIRNLDDVTGWFGLSQRIIDDIGAVALSLFLVMALMTLRLWELAGLALPLLVDPRRCRWCWSRSRASGRVPA